MELIKSNIKLEDIREHISHLTGNFGVPFNDFGFLWSKEEISERKKQYDEFFIKNAAMILGITLEEADKKTSKKNEHDLSKSYNWCWNHNLTYRIQLKKSSTTTVCVYINQESLQKHNIYFSSSASSKLCSFYIDDNGDILQDSKKVYNFFDDILKELKDYEVESITKELNKLKETEKKKRKALEATEKQIKKLEEELNKMK